MVTNFMLTLGLMSRKPMLLVMASEMGVQLPMVLVMASEMGLTLFLLSAR